MATICHQRRALMEISAPQPKITDRMRRSYLEILSSRMDPLSATPRSRSRTTNSRRGPLNSPINRQWRGSLEDQCDKMEDGQMPLSKQQLVQLVRSFVLVAQSKEQWNLSSDLKYLQDDLQLKKANVYRSIPYSRLGSNRDAHCYRKAYPHLVAFKVSCEEWGQALLRDKAWEWALEHALMAWRATSELPHWDTAGHNALREQCYRTLAGQCSAALQLHRPPAAKGWDLLRRFKLAQVHSQAMAPCIQELQRILQDLHASSVDTN